MYSIFSFTNSYKIIFFTAPVVVTSTSHAPPQGPGVVQHNYIPPNQPQPGFNAYQQPQVGGYPPQGAYPNNTQLPYPPQGPSMQPQPPYPTNQPQNFGVQPPIGFNQDPPSYDQVQQQNEMQTKQPPYNPNFTG